jgi:hypothetical protein
VGKRKNPSKRGSLLNRVQFAKPLAWPPALRRACQCRCLCQLHPIARATEQGTGVTRVGLQLCQAVGLLALQCPALSTWISSQLPDFHRHPESPIAITPTPHFAKHVDGSYGNTLENTTGAIMPPLFLPPPPHVLNCVPPSLRLPPPAAQADDDPGRLSHV